MQVHATVESLPGTRNLWFTKALLYKQTQNAHMRFIAHAGPTARRQNRLVQHKSGLVLYWAAVPASSACNRSSFSSLKPPLAHLSKSTSALYKRLLLLCGPPAHSGSSSRSAHWGQSPSMSTAAC